MERWLTTTRHWHPSPNRCSRVSVVLCCVLCVVCCVLRVLLFSHRLPLQTYQWVFWLNPWSHLIHIHLNSLTGWDNFSIQPREMEIDSLHSCWMSWVSRCWLQWIPLMMTVADFSANDSTELLKMVSRGLMLIGSQTKVNWYEQMNKNSFINYFFGWEVDGWIVGLIVHNPANSTTGDPTPQDAIDYANFLTKVYHHSWVNCLITICHTPLPPSSPLPTKHLRLGGRCTPSIQSYCHCWRGFMVHYLELDIARSIARGSSYYHVHIHQQHHCFWDLFKSSRGVDRSREIGSRIVNSGFRHKSNNEVGDGLMKHEGADWGLVLWVDYWFLSLFHCHINSSIAPKKLKKDSPYWWKVESKRSTFGKCQYLHFGGHWLMNSSQIDWPSSQLMVLNWEHDTCLLIKQSFDLNCSK